jgi:flagellar hook-associated protein FlgK
MDLFYGVKAAVQEIPQLTIDHVYGRVDRIPASITSGAIGSITGALGDTIYAEGDLTFNGVPMGALAIVDDGGVARLQVTRTNDLGESFSAFLPVTGAPAAITDVAGVFTITAEQLAQYFTAHTYNPATSTPAAYASGGIWADLPRSIGTTVSVQALVGGGSALQFDRAIDTRPEALIADSEIRIGLGDAGRTTQLAKLGFRTGVYLTGEVKEDLLVFANGVSGSAFRLGATFTEGDRDAVETLRAEPFEVSFTSPTTYTIKDVLTNTVVAERLYDPSVGVMYRGVSLRLNAEPVAGDRFLVDGNQDGIGNNGTALRLAELQNNRVVGNGSYTLSEAYGNLVGETGNVAFQAGIAQKALEVVKDQAVQARDKVSGVSLDQEAADLIRFQQAYQASAKVMQTANTLFDAILGIR